MDKKHTAFLAVMWTHPRMQGDFCAGLDVLIHRTIDRHGADPWTAGGFTNPLGIPSIGFNPLHMWLHGLRSHEFHAMPQLSDFSPPVMRATTGFQTDEARRQLRQH